MEECSAPGSTCSSRSDAAAASPALQQPASPFEFEDVDCKANRPLKASAAGKQAAPGAGIMSAGAVGDLLGDSVQSPLPAIKETGEIMAKLVLMYVVLEVAAGLIKGQSPLRHLLLAAVHLKMVFQAMLAPLSMMCSGFVLALVQYSLLVKKQQRAGMRSEGVSDAAAAAQGKSKAE